ncbi:MAG: hypothetical protein IIC29_08705, partial [Chloroflexi bacterium]|nr:hypothetical protein [Chloroflexota bacterium]
MPSERVQRRIDELLDQAEAAMAARDWDVVAESARMALVADPENDDAKMFISMVEETEVSTDPSGDTTPPTSTQGQRGVASAEVPISDPTSFANDRYQVSKFLGEGGKKRVYLAHDTLLDR